MTEHSPGLTCTYCHGARLVGWRGAEPILCPECSRGKDWFAIITQAWREQRAKLAYMWRCAEELEAAAYELSGDVHDQLLEARAEIDRLRAHLADSTETIAGLTQTCTRQSERLGEYEAQLMRDGKISTPVARSIDDWHEDYGPVLWWKLPVCEPPYAGSPLDDDWPGYHTHWTPIVCPEGGE